MSQEKRNKILAITLVVFTLATICVMFFDGDANDKAIDKNIFRFSNLDEVDRIVLQSHKDTIVLSFNGSFWMVNDKYRADNNMIRVLFATLSQAEPRRAITGESQDSISLHLDSTATSVSVGVKENLSKQFDAGGNTSK
ncbi:MAG TPA: hypothetical protein VD927_12650, partial [Chryseosolibacter sp.]|nr:hypothetical protein [Chryseosolibacter sp.]